MVEDGSDPRREYERERDELLRRATLYSVGFFSAAVAVAVGGAALIAWLLSLFGWPFRTTWLVIAGGVLLASLVLVAVGAVQRRSD